MHRNFFFFDLKTFLKVLKSHLFSPTYFILPTIDLTCCCKKEREIKLIIILLPVFLIFAFRIVLIGLFAEQDEDLKSRKIMFAYE